MRTILASAAALALAAASGAGARPGKSDANGKWSQAPAAQGRAQGDRAKGHSGDRKDARRDATADEAAPLPSEGHAARRGKPASGAKGGRLPGEGRERPRAHQRAKRAVPPREASGAEYDRTIRPGASGRSGVRPGAGRPIREVRLRDHDREPIPGCPPGLAKRDDGCAPPGLARRQSQRFYGYDYGPRLFGLSHYQGGRYLLGDGYLMRLGSDGRVAGYIPLLGGALAVGKIWPRSYASYPLSDYYIDYYGLGPAASYRYADDVIFRVDPENAAIMSVAALLTGDEIAIGRPMPPGYDVYNVPYAYRDRYADTPEASYRYSDGYVYRIDPATQRVAEAIELLV